MTQELKDLEHTILTASDRVSALEYELFSALRQEIADAEGLMAREGIRWLNSTTKSIEEISATIMADLGLDKRRNS